MSTAAIRAAIMGRIEAEWSTTDIAYPNSHYEPDPTTPWVAVDIVSADARAGELGNSMRRYTGHIFTNIYVPINAGLGLAYTYSDSIATIWDFETFSDVKCGVSRRREGPIQNGWAQLTVITPFRLDLTT